eukprot:GFUD01010862.1.p1 GENE.GFUD01010862.1~~GFUD01010862.1.p1  ORF type:complete len:336 (-),score=84.25 GFUD01010862.1:3-1010(-)
MGSEKFCLRWNDFESNISFAFRELRDDKDFFDVTLACDDEQIQAHKVILSACSPFFRNILRRNPHQHPLLYLKGVKYTDLQSVLNFMYHGEVNVAQEELNSFLAVAEDLRVKGLTQNQSGGTTSSKKENTFHPNHNLHTEREAAPVPKRQRPPPPSIQSNQHNTTRPGVEDDDIQEVVPVKSEPRDAPLPMTQTPDPMYSTPQPPQMTHALAPAEDDSLAYQETGYGEYDQYAGEGDLQAYDGTMMGELGVDGNKGGRDFLNTYIERIVEGLSRGKFKCSICGKINGRKDHAENHIESIHFPGTFQYNCKYCELVFTGRNKLYLHVNQMHQGQKQ